MKRPRAQIQPNAKSRDSTSELRGPQLALSRKAVLSVAPMLSAEQVIERYQLQPLDQEGGFFRRVWSSGVHMDNAALGDQYTKDGTHESGSLIYFLLTDHSFSAMHRLKTAEHWFYHLGDPLELLFLHPDGSGETLTLGPELENGHTIHAIAPAQSWQGGILRPTAEARHCGFCLVSCMLVPGFDWDDFQLAEAGDLLETHPEFTGPILRRTRYNPAEGQR